MYFLGVDNCTYTEAGVKMICGVSDFEVTVDKKIIALSDGKVPASNSDEFVKDLTTNIWYCMYDNKKGLTLIKDLPIFIGLDNKTSSVYNSQKLVSISAGIDGSLWGLEYEPDVLDYQLVKWQEITKKWYKIKDGKGVNIAGYNEISVAVVNSFGLVSLSSSQN